MNCKHCDERIEQVPFGGWNHAATRRAMCASGNTYATPKES